MRQNAFNVFLFVLMAVAFTGLFLASQVIIGAMLSRHPVGRTLLHPLLDT